MVARTYIDYTHHGITLSFIGLNGFNCVMYACALERNKFLVAAGRDRDDAVHRLREMIDRQLDSES